MSQVRRFDHIGITLADLDTVTAFFVREHIDRLRSEARREQLGE